MSTGLLFMVLLAAVVLVAIQIERRMRRGKAGRSLAAKFARERNEVNLGMEASDEARVAPILQANDALAHLTGASSRSGSRIAAKAQSPAPFPDDETYAARYSGTHNERT